MARAPSERLVPSALALSVLLAALLLFFGAEPETVVVAPARPPARGIRGCVLDADGRPARAATVWLFPSLGTQDVTELWLAHDRGIAFRPLGRVATDAAGRFAFTLPEADEPLAFELSVVAGGLVELRLPDLRVATHEQRDVGELRLERGVSVVGTVTRADRPDERVAGALVCLCPAFRGPAQVPGRENGITARADARGHYCLTGVPPGSATLVAMAAGFARDVRPDVQLALDAEVRCDFRLTPGLAIRGTVVTAGSASIAPARVAATSIATEPTLRTEAWCGPDGSFELLGLDDASYVISVAAGGFARATFQPIAAGSERLRITLEPTSAVRLRVLDKTGRRLERFDAVVMTPGPCVGAYFPTAPTQRVLLRNGQDAVIGGLEPTGDERRVLRVEAEGHVMKFSPPFAVVPGVQPAPITLRLDEGGRIEGSVTDESGAPLAGVEVRTVYRWDEDRFRLSSFGVLAPLFFTRKTVATQADGTFRIPLLCAGKYGLKLTAPGRCDAWRDDLDVEAGRPVALSPVRMKRGTQLSGVVRIGASRAGATQVRVTVSGIRETGEIDAAARFECEAMTDEYGRFVLGNRLPPGQFEVLAARLNGGPFEAILDMQRSRREVRVLDEAKSEVELTIEEK